MLKTAKRSNKSLRHRKSKAMLLCNNIRLTTVVLDIQCYHNLCIYVKLSKQMHSCSERWNWGH